MKLSLFLHRNRLVEAVKLSGDNLSLTGLQGFFTQVSTEVKLFMQVKDKTESLLLKQGSG